MGRFFKNTRILISQALIEIKLNHMYRLLSFLFLVILLSCSSNDQSEKNHSNGDVHTKGHDSKANQHMHRHGSIEELIARFDDPERNEWQQPEKVIELMGDLSNKTVLDIGAGSGYFSFRLAKTAKKVLAADVEKKFLQHIQDQIEEKSLENIDTLLIPYDGPDSLSKEINTVIIVNTYHHIEDRITYFTELNKNLPEGAELFVVDFKKNLEEGAPGPPAAIRLSYEEVRQELKKAGFRNFSVDLELLPYQYVLKAET